jgi:hypothetical protein
MIDSWVTSVNNIYDPWFCHVLCFSLLFLICIKFLSVGVFHFRIMESSWALTLFLMHMWYAAHLVIYIRYSCTGMWILHGCRCIWRLFALDNWRLTKEPRIWSQATSWEIHGGQSGMGAGFPLLIISPPLLHTHLSPPPERAAQYHILGL